jgi:hypothetical protein
MGGGWFVGGGGWFCVGGGPSVGGRAGRFVMGGGPPVVEGTGSSVVRGGPSVAGGTGSSVVGGGSSAEGVEGSSAEGVEGSSVAGSSVSAVEGGGDVGSLGVGASSSSSAGGAISPVPLLGELLLVLLGGNVSREGSSRVTRGADGAFVDGGDCSGSVVLGAGRAAETGAGPALADRLVAISWSLSPAHGIPEPTAAAPSRALLSTASPSAPISATTCSTATSRGWLMGLSESGASHERSETATTAAATTPAPASAYQRPALPRRRRRPMRAAWRSAGF